MKKSFFFVTEYKYNFIYHNRFKLNYLSKKFKVYIVDLSIIFSPDLKKKLKRLKNFKRFYLFKNIRDFEKLLFKKTPDYVFMYGEKEFKEKIYGIIKKNSKAKILDFYNATIPDIIPLFNNYALKKILFSTKILIFFPIFFKKVFKVLYYKFCQKFLLKKEKEKYQIDYLFYSGKSTLNLEQFRDKIIKKKIAAPSFDYEKSLSIINQKKIYPNKYAVFFDQMITSHDDYKLSSIFSAPKLNNYFKDMNNFFAKVERELNLEIIIALHPTCTINNYSRFFNNRIAFKNKTPELVKYAEIVYLHPYTTSISFPIIFKRPFVFLTTNEMNNNFTLYKSALIKNKLFKDNLINVNNIRNTDLIRKPKINYSEYNYYKKNFLNSNKSKNTNLYKTILENLD